MKLIYSSNLNHAYIVTERQLAKLIYNCVGIYCCVVQADPQTSFWELRGTQHLAREWFALSFICLVLFHLQFA